MRPLAVIWPRSGCRMRARHFSSVDLPDPFEPIKPNVEPSGTSKETSSTAQNSS